MGANSSKGKSRAVDINSGPVDFMYVGSADDSSADPQAPDPRPTHEHVRFPTVPAVSDDPTEPPQHGRFCLWHLGGVLLPYAKPSPVFEGQQFPFDMEQLLKASRRFVTAVSRNERCVGDFARVLTQAVPHVVLPHDVSLYIGLCRWLPVSDPYGDPDIGEGIDCTGWVSQSTMFCDLCPPRGGENDPNSPHSDVPLDNATRVTNRAAGGPRVRERGVGEWIVDTKCFSGHAEIIIASEIIALLVSVFAAETVRTLTFRDVGPAALRCVSRCFHVEEVELRAAADGAFTSATFLPLLLERGAASLSEMQQHQHLQQQQLQQQLQEQPKSSLACKETCRPPAVSAAVTPVGATLRSIQLSGNSFVDGQCVDALLLLPELEHVSLANCPQLRTALGPAFDISSRRDNIQVALRRLAYHPKLRTLNVYLKDDEEHLKDLRQQYEFVAPHVKIFM